MKWFEYKQEVDALHAPDSLKDKLLAMQAGENALGEIAPAAPKRADTTSEKQTTQGAKKRTALRFPRWQQIAALAACFAFGVVACDAFGWQVLPRMGSGYAADGYDKQSALYSMNDMAAGGAEDSTTAETSTADAYAENSADAAVDTAGGSQVTLPKATGRKIIYTANLSLESKAYDDTLAALSSAVSAAGGYVESSEESNYGTGCRASSLTCRIPADAYEDFLGTAAQTGSLLSKSQSADDITADYVDVAARIDALQTQRTRLQELEQQANNLTDLLQIESSLSDVQYQLESYEAQKKLYDDQVDFCTVDISLEEVETFTPTETNFWARFVRALSDALVNFGNTLANLIFWLAARWPWLVAVAAAIVLIVFFQKRKGRNI
ncbi:MAG: DUF4349 domain-containing protein [Faecalibacterium sp.]|jgi:hypothetical protein|nr:DUF4349 domain-containing protein [Faecalibacterium sp.]